MTKVVDTIQKLKGIYPELREAAHAEVKYRLYRSLGVCFANIVVGRNHIDYTITLLPGLR